MTAYRLREILEYDSLTGLFRWKVQLSNRAPIGSIAGTNIDGYCGITINKTHYKAHRLAWLYVYSKWPDSHLDHVNGKRSDNRICNLREVTPQQNTQNVRSARSTNKLGILGVCLVRNRYRAQVVVNGRIVFSRNFKTPEEAHEAYLIAKRQFHSTCTI